MITAIGPTVSEDVLGFMSLEIPTETVAEVLLAGGWHKVKPQTFSVNIHESSSSFTDGQDEHVATIGVSWTAPDGSKFYCSLTAVHALKTTRPRESG